jgi:uncharacterized membrane protein YhaH (DUF805 family)
MGFGEAIATCLRKYAVFRGRATRPEYWFFALLQVLLALVLRIAAELTDGRAVAILSVAVVSVMFLPGLAVTVRRLHDTDRRGWWVLICPLVFIGPIIMILLLSRPGTPGANRFGLGPDHIAIPELFA